MEALGQGCNHLPPRAELAHQALHDPHAALPACALQLVLLVRVLVLAVAGWDCLSCTRPGCDPATAGAGKPAWIPRGENAPKDIAKLTEPDSALSNPRGASCRDQPHRLSFTHVLGTSRTKMVCIPMLHHCKQALRRLISTCWRLRRSCWQNTI